ncbi:hypothetical protein Tco_1351493 [Tanacetum coccineum]
MTQIESYPAAVLGSLVMKSIVIFSHFHSGFAEYVAMCSLLFWPPILHLQGFLDFAFDCSKDFVGCLEFDFHRLDSHCSGNIVLCNSFFTTSEKVGLHSTVLLGFLVLFGLRVRVELRLSVALMS